MTCVANYTRTCGLIKLANNGDSSNHEKQTHHEAPNGELQSPFHDAGLTG